MPANRIAAEVKISLRGGINERRTVGGSVTTVQFRNPFSSLYNPCSCTSGMNVRIATSTCAHAHQAHKCTANNVPIVGEIDHLGEAGYFAHACRPTVGKFEIGRLALQALRLPPRVSLSTFDFHLSRRGAYSIRGVHRMIYEMADG